jgi:hypothetical protein
MSAWWWVPIGLGAWFLVSLAAGLVIGPWLRNASQAREVADYPVSNVRVIRPPGLNQIRPGPAADLLPRPGRDDQGEGA